MSAADEVFGTNRDAARRNPASEAPILSIFISPWFHSLVGSPRQRTSTPDASEREGVEAAVTGASPQTKRQELCFVPDTP
jgi:hypothetical protein